METYSKTLEDLLYLKAVLLETMEPIDWKRIPTLVSYCCDSAENKDMYSVPLNTTEEIPGNQYMVSMDDIINGQKADVKTMIVMRKARERLLKFSRKKYFIVQKESEEIRCEKKGGTVIVENTILIEENVFSK